MKKDGLRCIGKIAGWWVGGPPAIIPRVCPSKLRWGGCIHTEEGTRTSRRSRILRFLKPGALIFLGTGLIGRAGIIRGKWGLA